MKKSACCSKTSGNSSAPGCTGESLWHCMLYMGFTSQPGCGSPRKCSVSLMCPTTELRKHSLENAAPDGKISMLRTGGRGKNHGLSVSYKENDTKENTHIRVLLTRKPFVFNLVDTHLTKYFRTKWSTNRHKVFTTTTVENIQSTYSQTKCLLTKFSTVNLEDAQVLPITKSQPHLGGVLGPGAGSAVPTHSAVKGRLLVWAHREAERQTRERVAWGRRCRMEDSEGNN